MVSITLPRKLYKLSSSVSDDRSGVEMKLLKDHIPFEGPNAQYSVHLDLRKYILDKVVPVNVFTIKRELSETPN